MSKSIKDRLLLIGVGLAGWAAATCATAQVTVPLSNAVGGVPWPGSPQSSPAFLLNDPFSYHPGLDYADLSAVAPVNLPETRWDPNFATFLANNDDAQNFWFADVNPLPGQRFDFLDIWGRVDAAAGEDTRHQDLVFTFYDSPGATGNVLGTSAPFNGVSGQNPGVQGSAYGRFEVSSVLSAAQQTQVESFRIDHTPGNTDFLLLQEVRAASLIGPDVDPYLVIDRSTGDISIVNNTTTPVNFVAYSLLSPTVGAINAGEWQSISDTDDEWIEFSAPGATNNLSEGEVPGGDGMTIAAGESLSFGDVWYRTPTEDIGIQLLQDDGTFRSISTRYTGDDGPLPLGDLNADGEITPADWPLFRAGFGGTFDGQSLAQSYTQGDLDGDGDTDILDFRQFEAIFDVANGAGALADVMSSQSVPEPSSLALCSMVCAALFMKWGRGLKSRSSASEDVFHNRIGSLAMQRTIAIVGVGISLAFGQVDRASADLLDLSAAPVFQSSEYDPNYNVATAFDNSLVEPSRWASSPTGDEFRQEWIYVDLDMDRQLNSVAIDWQAANARTFSVRAWPSALGDPGGAATDPNDPNWSAVATATETNAAPADAFIGDDQKFDFAAGFAFDPTNLGGTLEVNTLNPVARYLMIETSRQSVYNLSSIWEVRVDADAPNSPIKLQVNAVSGQVSIVNNASLAEARNINSYQIISEGNSLNHGSWDGLGGQTGFPAGNGTGNGWEEGESSGDDSLAEAFLLGGSDVALNATLSLGAAYDASVDARDLVFLYSETDGLLRRGTVEYISAAVPGDYNSNGVVDAADYTVWRDHLGQSFQLANEVSGVTPGTVTSQDYDAWKSRFGNTSGSGAALGGTTAVPEPSTCGLCVLLALAGLARRTIRRRPLRTTVAGIGAIGRSCDNATHN